MGNWTSFALMMKGASFHFLLSSSQVVLSLTLYICSSFIRKRVIWFKKSSSLACSLTVSKSSSFLSAFSLWMSYSSFVAVLSLFLSFLMIFRLASTSSCNELYYFSFSSNSSSCFSFSSSSCIYFIFSSSKASYIFLCAYACSLSLASNTSPPYTSYCSIYLRIFSRFSLFMASSYSC